MPEPYQPIADEPAERSRLALVAVFVALFAVGFGVVFALLVLRAPDAADRTAGESALAALLVEPPGYERLADPAAGGGPLSASRAAGVLGTTELPGYEDGLLRAWGRKPGEPPRAVVLLAVEVADPRVATEVRQAYVRRVLAAGGEPFSTPSALGAAGFHDLPDAANRHAQRVVFTRGSRLFVVSVVTRTREADTAEVVRLATAQAERAA